MVLGTDRWGLTYSFSQGKKKKGDKVADDDGENQRVIRPSNSKTVS
jgi:hypothetical protein